MFTCSLYRQSSLQCSAVRKVRRIAVTYDSSATLCRNHVVPLIHKKTHTDFSANLCQKCLEKLTLIGRKGTFVESHRGPAVSTRTGDMLLVALMKVFWGYFFILTLISNVKKVNKSHKLSYGALRCLKNKGPRADALGPSFSLGPHSSPRPFWQQRAAVAPCALPAHHPAENRQGWRESGGKFSN